MMRKHDSKILYDRAVMKIILKELVADELAEFDAWNKKHHDYSDGFSARLGGILHRWGGMKNGGSRRSRRIVIFIAVAVALTLAACTAIEPVRTKIIETITKITHIYDPYECALPDGYSYFSEAAPFYDEYTGKLTVAGRKQYEETDDDGNFIYRKDYKLFTYDLDGIFLGDISVSSDCNSNIVTGELGKEEFICIERRNNEFYLVKRSCEDGSIRVEAAISDLLGGDSESLYSYLLTDGEGNIWFGNESTAAVVGADFILKEILCFENPVISPVCGNDGKIYGLVEKDNSRYFSEICIDGIKEITETDSKAQKLSFAKHTAEDDAGYDFYYNTADAVYGARLNDDGSASEEKLLDYKNSGIINNAKLKLMGIAADGYEFMAVFTEDLMLFGKTAYIEGEHYVMPVFYRSADDIDLAEVTVIEFAHANQLEDNIYAQILAYDQAVKDVNVIIHDYSKYNNFENPDGGAWRLVTDILNGVISPDIVFGNPADTEITQLVEKKIYTDLMPYFESDDEVNPDTVFGCVQNAFTNRNGEMWGITPYFFLSSVLSTNDILGEYADSDTWTLEEFLDFAEQYGSDAMFGFTREFAAEYMESVYGIFCDTENAACTFDSPLFKRYLEFLYSLPTEEEYGYTELGQVSYSDRYYYHKDGTVPLKEYNFGGGLLGLRYAFDTKHFKLIGYPTDEDRGAVLFSRMAFVVTDRAENPKSCWEFIKSFMHTDYGIWMSGPGTTSMKNLYLEEVLKSRGKMIRKYEDGQYFDDEQAKMYESIGIPVSFAPYTLEKWDEETIMRGIEYMDSEGMHLSDKPAYEIKSIIYEEISAYFAGQGNSDDCAKKIQSRVSIWLSEKYG